MTISSPLPLPPDGVGSGDGLGVVVGVGELLGVVVGDGSGDTGIEGSTPLPLGGSGVFDIVGGEDGRVMLGGDVPEQEVNARIIISGSTSKISTSNTAMIIFPRSVSSKPFKQRHLPSLKIYH